MKTKKSPCEIRFVKEKDHILCSDCKKEPDYYIKTNNLMLCEDCFKARGGKLPYES